MYYFKLEFDHQRSYKSVFAFFKHSGIWNGDYGLVPVSDGDLKDYIHSKNMQILFRGGPDTTGGAEDA